LLATSQDINYCAFLCKVGHQYLAFSTFWAVMSIEKCLPSTPSCLSIGLSKFHHHANIDAKFDLAFAYTTFH
jgi:hypothetical protein